MKSRSEKMASGQRFLKREARRAAKGFTLMEAMIATLLLLVGLVAAAELVPVAGTRDTQSRNDSKAAVVAEQVMDQILSQPLSTTIATITVDGLPFATGIGGPGAGAAGRPLCTGTGEQIGFAGARAVPHLCVWVFYPRRPPHPPPRLA